MFVFALLAAPVPSRHPASWGSPPAAMTLDLVPLPGGYGQGSSTEAQWIARQMVADHERGRVQFPPVWGAPPAAQTRDFVPLPLGYGMVRAERCTRAAHARIAR